VRWLDIFRASENQKVLLTGGAEMWLTVWRAVVKEAKAKIGL
jgi:hypothetical protein